MEDHHEVTEAQRNAECGSSVALHSSDSHSSDKASNVSCEMVYQRNESQRNDPEKRLVVSSRGLRLGGGTTPFLLSLDVVYCRRRGPR